MLEVVTDQVVLDALPAAAAIVDETGAIVAVNRAWTRFAEENGGDSRSHYLGWNYLEICAAACGESSAMATAVGHGLHAALAGDDEFHAEYPCDSPAEHRWFEVTVSPLRAGGRRFALVMHRDVTRRRRAEQDVASQEDLHRLADLVVASTDAIISFDLDGIVRTWNPAATEFYGYEADEIIGRPLETLYPEDWPIRCHEYRDLILAGKLRRFEAVRRAKSGRLRDVHISAAPVRGPDGDVVAVLNIHRDITEAKANREHLALVTRELSHRAKNMLAIILSIERQTARTARSLDEFHQSFSARLRALQTSIDLLANRDWGRVSMAELARSQLAVFTGPDDARVEIAGPEVTLDTQAVEAVGMSLHELATNALKHGALGPQSGQVRLGWSVVGEADAALAIRWDESSPAILGPPEKVGFGHVVMTRVTERKLGAKVGIEFRPGRLAWTAVLPRQHFVAGEALDRSAPAPDLPVEIAVAPPKTKP